MAVEVPFPGGPHRLMTQLDTGSGTEGEDCVFVTCINGIRYMSRGKVGPKEQDDVGFWVKRIRQWAGRRTGPGYLRTDALKIYRHPELKELFAKANMSRPQASLRMGIDYATDLKALLKKGQFVHLQVSYAVINKNRPEPPSGDFAFKEDHSLCILGAETAAGLVYTNEGDPLFDGRRSNVPKGWQSIRYSWMREPAGKFGDKPWGVGKAECITLKLSSSTVVPPDPTPTPTPEFDFAKNAKILEDMAAEMRKQEAHNG